MFRIPLIPSGIRISRIACVDTEGRSPKMIGKNARLDDHGATARERLVRIFTGDGHHGFGVTRARPEDIEAEASEVIGRPLASLVDPEEGIRLRGLEHALWDVIGQAVGQPVYALLGESCRPAVEAYDGGLYFCDLLYPDRGLDQVAREAEESIAQGHRAIKMKIGRGHRWMSPEEGFRRDIEAIRLVRKTAGPEMLLMVDGNNGFDREGAERLFEAVGDQRLYWAEEMFPETLDDYARFRWFLEQRGLDTLLADGETLPAPDELYPYIEQRLIDVVQLDMNQIGLSAWWKLAAFAHDYGVLCAPHTWSSRFALYASLHLGKAIPNFLSAEVPAYLPDVYRPAGFEFHHGAYRIHPLPGWGLRLDEGVYKRRYAPQERAWP
jgi:L-alanine-DL-glutamate epimerase-like enolase superfamily enzyme